MMRYLPLIIFNLAFSGIFGLPGAGAVEFPAQDVQIDASLSATPNNSIHPVIRVDGSGNLYAAWEDDRNGPSTIFFNHRFPDAAWESQPVALTTGNPRSQDVDQGDATDPQICSDNSGRVYVVWVDDRAVKAGTGKRDIYLRYSTDFGISWFPEFIDYRLDTDTPNPGDSILPQIACDDDGHLYVAWLDDKNVTGNYEVYFRSIQFTFQFPADILQPLQFPDLRLNIGEAGKPVSPGSFATLTPRIAADGLGGVYAVWEDTREDASQEVYPGIYFNVSRDHGASWRGNDNRIDHRPVGGGPFRSSEPKIAVDNSGRVHVIWIDNGDRPLQSMEAAGRRKLFYNRSLDYGDTWAATDTRISDIPRTKEVIYSDISVNNRNGVFVVWTDNSQGATSAEDASNSQSTGDTRTQTGSGTTTSQNYHLFFNHSENSGGTWRDTTDKIQIDIGNNDSDVSNPKIVADNIRNVFVTWEDSRNSAYQDIYFNFSPENGRKSSWQETGIRVDNPSSRGNSTSVQVDTDGVGKVHLVFSDDRKSFGTSAIYYNGVFVDIRTLLKGPRIAEGCFIATAVFGSATDPHVLALRRFRDQYLLPHLPGRIFVTLYYRFSPSVAGFLNDHPEFTPPVRLALLPVVGGADWMLKTTAAQKILLFFGMMAALSLLLLVFKKRGEE
ncbi:MAG: exo-alpha-sialidase [Nitrospirae bacterium]|nr:exo-alpha-sialidase [Nitrospirota bacterium]